MTTITNGTSDQKQIERKIKAAAKKKEGMAKAKELIRDLEKEFESEDNIDITEASDEFRRKYFGRSSYYKEFEIHLGYGTSVIIRHELNFDGDVATDYLSIKQGRKEKPVWFADKDAD